MRDELKEPTDRQPVGIVEVGYGGIILVLNFVWSGFEIDVRFSIHWIPWTHPGRWYSLVRRSPNGGPGQSSGGLVGTNLWNNPNTDS